MNMTNVKARYENNVLRPLEKLDLGEGEEVEIEVKRASVEDFHGSLEIAKEIADEIIELELWN
jgi:predicted DNA-binding antitoxin AbrB/MazE fold protein